MHLINIAAWSLIIFYILHLVITNNGVGAQPTTKRRQIDHHSSMSHSHMDHSVLVFFTLNDLKVGKNMPVYFRGADPSSSPKFLPREEAELIPFSSSEFPYLLKHFGFRHDSSQAKAMKDTLTQCEMQPIKGETKLCATSLESMLDFAQQIFGSMTDFRGISTRELTNKLATDHLQNFTIVDEPRELYAPKLVACHTMPYPYAIFYCHYQESESKVFQVSLSGENGSKVEAVAVCHMDTSQWSTNHVSFRVLGIEPGSSPICHFFPADNLVWVPLLNAEGQEGKTLINNM